MRLLPNALLGRIAESDFAGEIVDPNGCDRFKAGDQVFGTISSRVSFRTRQGALAQYMFGPAETIVHRPESIPVNEASGIPVVAVTAHQALFDVGNLKPGKKLFINGGSTSVGIYAIQFAKGIGCEVHASASGKNEDFLKRLGVDEVSVFHSSFSRSSDVNDFLLSVYRLHKTTSSRSIGQESTIAEVRRPPRGRGSRVSLTVQTQ
jgi:NADPH:quinone reductase-like Zn-dependent oxidoreductase